MLFYAYFSVLKKRNIKRSPNGMKPLGELFLERKQSRRLGVDVKEAARRPRGRATCLGGQARPHPRGPLAAPPTYFFRLYILLYPENIATEDRSRVSPPQASVATKSQLGPCSGTLPEGGSLTGGHLHHPTLSMTRRE